MEYRTEEQTTYTFEIFNLTNSIIDEHGELSGHIENIIEYDAFQKKIVARIIECTTDTGWKNKITFKKIITYQEMFDNKIDMSKLFPRQYGDSVTSDE
tara:strand:- start:1160 stop:1453 length:294 start_codon:yes stop_codon:yes gene_type:complete